ncbi:MAG: YceD family protein [Chitinophagaceae bacterium]
MSHGRNYDIAFVGLKPGTHVFEYEIQDEFFSEFPKQDFRNCQAHVKLTLDKHSNFLQLNFEIGGKLELDCDRCGNPLPLELWDEFKVLVKMTEDPEAMNEEEEDPDVFYISRTESHLHLIPWIYEFINLSVPMQRQCSEEMMGGPYCNLEVLAKLKEMEARKEAASNPVWKELDKFKATKK